MKTLNIFLVLIFLIVCQISFGQTTSTHPDTLQKEALAFYKAGNLDASLEYFDKVIAIYRTTKDTLKLGKALRFKGGIEIGKNTYSAFKSAELSLLEAIDIFKNFDKKQYLYSCYQYLGIINRDIEQPVKAKNYFHQSLQYAKTYTGVLDTFTYKLGTAYRWLGTSYNKLGELDSSLYYLNQSYEVMQHISHSGCPDFYRVESLLNLASTEKQADLLVQAENHINQARDYINTNPCLKSTLFLLYAIEGSVFRKKRLNDKVIENYDKALKLAEEFKLKERQSELLNDYGAFFFEQEEYIKAIAHFEQSLSVLDTNEINHNKQITAHQNIAVAYMGLKQFERAKPYLDTALTLGKKYFPNTARLVAIQNNYAKWLEKTGKYDSAIEIIQQAISINTDGFSNEHTKANPLAKGLFFNKNELFISLLVKSTLLSRKLENTLDIDYGQIALATISLADSILSQLRLELDYEEDKLKLIEESKELYPLGAKVCYELFQVTKDKSFLEQAFIYVEKSKSLLLFEEIKLKGAFQKLGASTKEVIKYKSHQKNIIGLQKEIQQLRVSKNDEINRQKIKKLMGEISLHNTLIEEFNSKYIHSNSYLLVSGIPKLSIIQNEIASNEVLLNYVEIDGVLYLFLITNEDLITQKISIGENLEKNLEEYKRATTTTAISPRQFARISHSLYQQLILPMEKHLTGKQMLTIIPNQLLTGIYFDALVSKSIIPKLFSELKYLIDDFDIRYHYSASLWLSVRKEKSPSHPYEYIGIAPFVKAGLNIQIGNQEANATPLPNTKTEVENVKATFETQKSIIAIDEDSYIGYPSEEKLSAKIIHFATHSILHKNEIYYFVRSKEGTPLFFTKDDLYRHPYLDCHLLIFNSCHSGEGKYVDGEGIMSIVRPALYHDISNILVTFNPVPDNSSSELIQYFFKYISKGDSYSKAINKAKRDIKNQGFFPISWAGYIFIGID